MSSHLWKRAFALVKDKRSIYMAKMSPAAGRRSNNRRPELEAAMIKATSHDDAAVDYRNIQRVFSWLRASPPALKAVLVALTRRMERTRSWVVAIKGLMLTHGLVRLNLPAIATVGRLPFDLTKFHDRSLSPHAKSLSSFIQSYFIYLNNKSIFLASQRAHYSTEESLESDLSELQRLQTSLDMLLQIRPCSDNASFVLVLEAMDCVVIEIFQVYSEICKSIAGVLRRMQSATKSPDQAASAAVAVLYKAATQSALLPPYFEACRRLGVLNATEFPPVEQLPEEDIRDIERNVCGFLPSSPLNKKGEDDANSTTSGSVDDEDGEEEDNWRFLRGTVVKRDWVVFPENNCVVRSHDHEEGQRRKKGSDVGWREWYEFVEWQKKQRSFLLDQDH